VASFGGRLYELLFSVFSDDFSRGEILHNIIGHTGSGSDSEVGAALDALLGLVHSHNAALRPFSIYVKTVMDYLANLKHKHIRKLFTVLSELSIHTQVHFLAAGNRCALSCFKLTGHTARSIPTGRIARGWTTTCTFKSGSCSPTLA
jgi:hypothetical protein